MNKTERCKLLDDDLQHALRKETFDALFAKTVNSHADRLALEFGGAELTYRQLEKRVEGLKRFLLSYLGNSSAPVCVFIERKAELAITMMGVLCSGHTYVPLDPLMPKGRLESLLELIQPKLILHVDPAPNYLREKWPLVCLSEDMAHEEGGDRCEPASGGPAYIASPYHREDLRATPVSTAGVLNLLFWTRQHHGIHFEDRIAATMRPGLDASLCEMLTALLSGASLHFPEESLIRNPTAFIKWLEEKKITRLHLPTALTELMLAEEWPKEHPLKTVFASGKQLTKKPDGVPFTLINRYGPAENGFFSFEAKVDPHDSELIIPIGSAVSNVRWAILDESLQEVEEGKAGQLALGGLALIDGYYHNEEESQRSFIVHTRLGRRPERLFLTGDRVRQRKDGLLEFLGRCRCSPTSGLVDLECLLGQHPGVKQVAAKNNSWGEVSVYWVKKPGIATTSRGLLNFLKGRLSPSRMPRQILELQNMPLDL
ncbi:MAG: AMP-binding protein, partial [Chlamydiia bacterium]|nr:AMP-binding protein [Chlamydiia bacterium]